MVWRVGLVVLVWSSVGGERKGRVQGMQSERKEKKEVQKNLAFDFVSPVLSNFRTWALQEQCCCKITLLV